MSGVYKEVDPPSGWSPPSRGAVTGPTLNTVVFTDLDGQTLVTSTMLYPSLIHAGREGWNGLSSWSKQDVARMVEFMRELDSGLRASGELSERTD